MYVAGQFTRSQFRLVTGILAAALPVIVAAYVAARSAPMQLAQWLDNLHITVAYGTAAVLALLGVRWADDETRAARRWFAYGLIISVIAQFTSDIQTAIHFAHFPAPSDWLFVAIAPCYLVGLWHTILRQPNRPSTRVLLLDVFTLAAVLSMLILALVLPRHTGPIDLTFVVRVACPFSVLTSSCLAFIMVPTLRLAPTLQSGAFVAASMANGLLWVAWLFFAQDNAVTSNPWLYLLSSLVALAMGIGAMQWRVTRATSTTWIHRCDVVARILPLLVVTAAIVSALLAWSVPGTDRMAAITVYINAGLVMLLAAVRQSVMLFERERLLTIETRHNELERTFQTLFKITRGGLALLEADGRFREVNPSCIELLGYSDKELRQITINDVHAEPQFHLPGALGLVDTSGNGVIETLLRRKDGSVVDIELTSALIPGTGGHVFVILRNITARKQANEQLQSLAQRLAIATRAAGIGIWEHHLGKDVFVWDERMHELYGSIGHGSPPADWRQRIHPDDIERLEALYVRAMNEGRGYHIEFRIIRSDGSTRYLESWSDIQLDADGKPERIIGVNMDITARKQAEAVRTRLEAQLRHSQKLEAIGTLASGIAHDFNNVLGAILGNAELALQDLDDGHAAATSLEEIRKAGQRGKDLVRRIVAFGKPHELEFKPTQLTGVVEDSLKLVRAVLPASVEINCNLQLDAPHVAIDSSQIAQVLLNLCTNAYQAMDQHKGRIDIMMNVRELGDDSVQIHRDLKPGRYVCLTISDNGSGIDAAIVDRIFEPFFTTKSVTDGSGLGLSIVHNIVRSHGGAITLESQPGVGSAFHIYLPAPDDLQPHLATGKHLKFTAPTKGSGQHLLYVDDEASLVFLTKRMLERLGYRVTGFTEADEALAAALAADADFDLIITDHSMPVMSGMDLARELFDKRPDARVVLVSGYLPPHDIERARSIGIKDVILKPDTVDELAAAVHRLLSM